MSGSKILSKEREKVVSKQLKTLNNDDVSQGISTRNKKKSRIWKNKK